MIVYSFFHVLLARLRRDKETWDHFLNTVVARYCQVTGLALMTIESLTVAIFAIIFLILIFLTKAPRCLEHQAARRKGTPHQRALARESDRHVFTWKAAMSDTPTFIISYLFFLYAWAHAAQLFSLTPTAW